ncbi:MAG: M67 family metallopeptidase [Gemmatimonadota bacterium]
MRITLSPEHPSIIRRHAETGYPLEVCGFLLGRMDAAAGDFSVHKVRPAVNRRGDRSTRRYRIDPDDYRAAEHQAAELGCEVVGIYHSHPDAPARPSEYDREHAWPNSAYLILTVEAGGAGILTAWLLAEDRSGFDELDLEVLPAGRATNSARAGTLEGQGRNVTCRRS